MRIGAIFLRFLKEKQKQITVINGIIREIKNVLEAEISPPKSKTVIARRQIICLFEMNKQKTENEMAKEITDEQ